MDRDSFMRVWQRVRGEDGPPPQTEETEAALLERLAALAERQIAFARYLQRQSGFCRNRGALLEREEERRLRQLQREYFLCTGESLSPAGRAGRESGVLSALRSALQRERESAALCRRAASRFGERRSFYEAQAAAEERHERLLRHLLDRSWG